MGIKIYSEVIELPIEDLHPNDWNPNSVPPDIFAAIKDDITKNGFLGSIVIQKHNEKLNLDNVIINGEHRWKVMQELKEPKIPCTIIDVPDETAKALTIRLNREHGELLPNRVGELLWDLSKEGGRDIEFIHGLTGIPQGEVQSLIDIRDNDLASDMRNTDRTPASKEITCPECGATFERGAKKKED